MRLVMDMATDSHLIRHLDDLDLPWLQTPSFYLGTRKTCMAHFFQESQKPPKLHPKHSEFEWIRRFDPQ